MPAPPSDLFTAIPLENAFNCDRATLDERLKRRDDHAYGDQAYRGIPFSFGQAGQANAILLEGGEVRVSAAGARATYLVFAHIVEDRRRRMPAVGVLVAGDEVAHGEVKRLDFHS